MAVLGIGSVGVSHVGGAPAPKPSTQKFGDVLKTTTAKAAPHAPVASHLKPPKKPEVKTPDAVTAQRPAARALDQVSAAQTRMDKVLELAQSGKTFTPAELLALQTQMYRASQELDLAGKVVEKATGGVKQVLQTQV